MLDSLSSTTAHVRSVSPPLRGGFAGHRAPTTAAERGANGRSGAEARRCAVEIVLSRTYGVLPAPLRSALPDRPYIGLCTPATFLRVIVCRRRDSRYRSDAIRRSFIVPMRRSLAVASIVPGVPTFDCDQCGACCGTFPIFASAADAAREPRIGAETRALPDHLATAAWRFQLYPLPFHESCCFLGGDRRCDVYADPPGGCAGRSRPGASSARRRGGGTACRRWSGDHDPRARPAGDGPGAGPLRRRRGRQPVARRTRGPRDRGRRRPGRTAGRLGRTQLAGLPIDFRLGGADPAAGRPGRRLAGGAADPPGAGGGPGGRAFRSRPRSACSPSGARPRCSASPAPRARAPRPPCSRACSPPGTTWLGGNIGRSLLADLPDIRPDHRVVLELSSFMLHHLGRRAWSPHVAVVTMLTRDHLDWHGSAERYVRDKRQIVAHQTAGRRGRAEPRRPGHGRPGGVHAGPGRPLQRRPTSGRSPCGCRARTTSSTPRRPSPPRPRRA